jgi:hypothetical protein
MFLHSKDSDTLVKVTDVETLFNPTKGEISGRVQEGEEEQDPQSFSKKNLKFPSGEDLPRCWIDADYRM